MKKILALRIAALLILVTLTSCSETDLFADIQWESIGEVTVTHYLSGTKTEWVLDDRQQIEDVAEWFNKLRLVRKHFADGESPGDSDGGEVYSFVFDEGFSFAYGIYGDDDCYIIIDGWYKVRSPSRPF